MLRTLAAEAARRFGQRVSFAAVRPAARPEPVQVPGPPGQAEAASESPVEAQAASESPVEAPAGTLVSPAAGWQVSYAELDRLSDEAAAGLAFRGVLPGDVVALALPSTPEFPICYLAAVKIGAIVAGLDPRWPPVVLDRLTDLLRPTVTVAPFGLNVGPGPDGELIRVTPARDSRGALAGLRRAELPPPPLPPDPARPAVIAFNSSKSSGTPRGAVFGVRQLDAIRAAEAGERWGSGVGSVLLTAVPFAHYSLMTRLPTFLQSGQTCVLMGSWRAEQVPRLAAAVQANRLSGLPAQLAELAAQQNLPSDGLPHVEIIVSGGATTPAGLVAALRQRFGTPVQVTYGCAEAGLGLSTYPDDLATDVDGCVGCPMSGVTLALRDSAGHEVPRGETGQVLLRSSACMSGYWNDPQASTAAFTSDRFVRTGDLGRLNEEGRLVLAGPGGG